MWSLFSSSDECHSVPLTPFRNEMIHGHAQGVIKIYFPSSHSWHLNFHSEQINGSIRRRVSHANLANLAKPGYGFKTFKRLATTCEFYLHPYLIELWGDAPTDLHIGGPKHVQITLLNQTASVSYAYSVCTDHFRSQNYFRLTNRIIITP